jgi:hypothetical protein
MKDNSLVNRKSENQRAAINDLSTAGTTLSEEHLQLASGGQLAVGGGAGLRIASYQAASCTFNNDTDYNRVD